MTDTLQTLTAPEAATLVVPDSPTRLERPAYLMGFPFCYSTRTPNNARMDDLTPEKREPDMRRAMLQFLELYRFVASEALVYLVPTPRQCGLQDLVFTANLGAVLDHLPDRDVAVLSGWSTGSG